MNASRRIKYAGRWRASVSCIVYRAKLGFKIEYREHSAKPNELADHHP